MSDGDGFDIPDLPTRDAKIAFLVNFPGDQKELPPSAEDTIEADISRELRQEGITDQPVIVHQNTAFMSGGVMGADELHDIQVNTQETLLSVSQIQQAQRIVVNSMRKYEVPASMENVLMKAVSPTILGDM